MAVFLVIGCLVASAGFLKKAGPVEEKGIFGGPDPVPLLARAQGAELSQEAALGVTTVGGLALAGTDSGDAATISLLDGAAIKDPGVPLGPAFDHSGTVAYTVQRGDTLSKIASYFGISVETIVGANPGVKSNLLKAGQSLNILPTTGIIYQTRSGDTLESISSAFNIPQSKIMQFNRAVSFTSLEPGTAVVIPGGKNNANIAMSAGSLPNFSQEFIIPTNGYNWGILHHDNAVDIANSCGTPVVAAAEGLVVPDDQMSNVTDAWNEGYGNFVLITHPFGDNVRTRYAHLEKVSVSIGDYVSRGQTIGLMGKTGDATGCHVHFEVLGAQNPFIKK